MFIRLREAGRRMATDANLLAEKWTSRPFRRRAANLALYWTVAVVVGTALLWMQFNPLVGSRPHIQWHDASFDLLIGFMFSGLLGYSFHYKGKTKVWAAPTEHEALLMAAQIVSLREIREGSRIKWLAAVLVVHTAVFSLLGWLIENRVSVLSFPGQELAAGGLTAAWLVCWGAAAALLENAYRLRTAVDFLAKGDKGVIGEFFQAVHQPLPTNLVHAALPLALFLLGGYWCQVALTNWLRILGRG